MRYSYLFVLLAALVIVVVLFGCSNDDGNTVVGNLGVQQIALVWAQYGTF